MGGGAYAVRGVDFSGELCYKTNMIRTYEYRALPQKGQVRTLDRMLWMTRNLYNAALQERKECYEKTGNGIGLYDQMKSLTQIRNDDEEWRGISVRIGRGPLKTIDLAFKAFFRRCKSGEQPGYPRFKGRDRWRMLHLETNYQIRAGNGKWAFLTFKGLPGRLRVWRHRPFPATAKQLLARLVRDAKGWKLQVVLELPDVEPVAVAGITGIDVGIKHFLVTDTGEAIPNPRVLQRELKRLRVEQRALARKARGSGNRLRQKQRVTRLHMRVADRRRDFHYKTAAELIAKGNSIAVEDLNIKGLAKSKLARQVADVSWGQFIFRLESKAESAGLQVHRVDPKHTSQQCSGCGEIVRKSLAVRVHDCPHCGLCIDRDHNAAVNIKKRAGGSPSGAKHGAVMPACQQALKSKNQRLA